MALISTEEIKAGMVLEKDVKNSHGQILIRSGSELTERHLTLIRSWGVTEAAVKGNLNARLDLLEMQDIKPEAYARAEAALLPRFQCAGLSDPVMGELFRYCAARKAKAAHP
jgi:hypothetical protein